MQQAERGFAYKGQRRYDFDVAPRISRQERKTQRTTARDRSRILLVLFLAGIICMGIIVSAAYGASINYTNNQLREEITALQGEVDMLEIEIQTQSNIAKVQKAAQAELGMKYPEGDQLVILGGGQKVADRIGSAFRQLASK